MRIDWFTFIAQVVNFLVLAWLLKHFLYARIVQAMNDREAKIASRLEAAAQERAEAEQEADRFRIKSRELEEQRDQMLAQAKEEADSQRQQWLDAARREADEAKAQWLETLHREQHALLHDVRERMGQQVFAIARRALKELADTDLEQQIIRGFVERLQTLDAAEREAIAAGAHELDGEVEIRTSFPILPETRESVSRTLHQEMGDGIDVRYTTIPELICGVELRVHSHRLVWNLDSYLEGLEDHVFEALKERAETYATPQ